MVGSPDAIRALVEPPLVSSGVELWDVEMSRDTLRVLIDRPGGVDLDALADLAAKVVSPLLDEHPELTPDAGFTLEVSSPGVERTLRRPEHFAGYIGQPVAVKTAVPVEGARRHQGVLVAADDSETGAGGIVVQPDEGPSGHVVSIRYADIDRARTVLVWGPAAKPGGSKKPGAQKSNAKKNNRTQKDPGEKSGRLRPEPDPGAQAVKRSAASGREPAAEPVASREKDAE